MRTHTKSEPFRCPLCDHRSARKDYLQKHITKSHTGITLEQIESLHPDMYNIEEKITFIEGRESRTTEDIQDKVREFRLNLIRNFDHGQNSPDLVPQQQSDDVVVAVQQQQEFLRDPEVLRVEQEIASSSQQLLEASDLHRNQDNLINQDVVVSTSLVESPENLIMRREVTLFKI